MKLAKYNERKYDKSHLLVLFKMYNFEPGIVYVCEEMKLSEELLNFYITRKKEICPK